MSSLGSTDHPSQGSTVQPESVRDFQNFSRSKISNIFDNAWSLVLDRIGPGPTGFGPRIPDPSHKM